MSIISKAAIAKKFKEGRGYYASPISYISGFAKSICLTHNELMEIVYEQQAATNKEKYSK